MKKFLFLSLFAAAALNAEILVYGPGGPAPVLKELAKQFEAKSGEKVIVNAGPTPKWIKQAKMDADIIYSGNTSMMDGFVKAMSKQIKIQDVQVLNARGSGMIVRANNPKKIKKFEDLLKDGVNVMVVDGAGQVGLYEDMALKTGKIENLEKLRKNIKVYAKNSKAAVDEWKNNPNIDALIIWTHWIKAVGEKENKFIKADKNSIIYRAAEIAPTQKGLKNPKVTEFIEFTQSKEAQKVWEKEGWLAK
ncbi:MULTISPECIES: substrate-binding domain-containing protein [unclassified Campylobacter]|uniref:substrate-binding domain-containing protein n=1 Tax=unclassified Campylobacter TaxID=2593542 RepID=UPI0021E67855|nr:substrate-binding domain-containing protein [Campylobacter sp. CNRCH_2015_0338h]EGK7485852.1 solute-binding protein [Campylobacter lari]MCR8683076.1 substrate-binding domain-containing protein [Campylobacter sp. LMG 17559]MCV3472280.1 substrate-binding domain-containing protein [Campylobacter sp. CNRCH_2015_0338h]HEC1728330.1 substrate-binding domain-containing protein [Campylobacter lari]HEC1764243.1 substrate-binding domain-containing protein [Campylobacter lari]